MIKLGRNKDCTLCGLHEDQKVRCIPTTLYGPKGGHSRALLIVGEAPGASEVRKDEPFVGKAGLTLRRLYIDYFRLCDRADVYLGNAVRCRPPGNKTPRKTQLKSCHGFLLADIIRLQQEYNEVLVLTVGGTATSAVLGTSLRGSLRRQGDFVDWRNLLKWAPKPTEFEGMALDVIEAQGLGLNPVPEPCRVFSTYHPAYILREPSNAMSVKKHVQALSDYLDGKLDYELDKELVILEAPVHPPYALKRLSLDIETYGFIRGYPHRTYFHPAKSHKLDHVDPSDMCQTCGLSWRDPGGELHHAIFFMDDPGHRRRLWNWIKRCRQDAGFEYLLGQNISFDLTYLRYCYKEARILLDDPLPIMDLMVLNYLHDESRPEKSLKALAPLFRVLKYEGNDTDNVEYDNARVPELAQYNCQDTASTLRIAEKLESEIRGLYGPNTKKLQPFCMKWYSQILWLIVWMSESGLRMVPGRLWALFQKYDRALEAIKSAALRLYDMPLKGKGCEQARRAMMDRACDFLVERGISLPQLELTDVKGLVKFSADNRNSLMDLMGRDWEPYKQLKLFGSFQDVSGILDRYLYPLLVGSGPNHNKNVAVLLNSYAFPKWFPVPSEFEDHSVGGTKQARIVAKGPAIQTFPPEIKDCISCRFPGGWMVWFDYSQIELRVAALLSNDSAMMTEYQSNPDLHGKTAKLMFGPDIVDHPNYKSLYRQAGKTFNFRALYRGGAKKAQRTLMKELGVHLKLSRINQIDSAFWATYSGLKAWQDGLMRCVQARGFYELPLVGQSRLFLGGRKARERKLNEVVNLPVQAIAADIILSAQYHLWVAFKRENLKAVVPCNIYDAALIECPKHEIHAVRRIMSEVLPNPPFYEEMCRELGRSVPLEYEVKEKRLC